MAIHTVLLTRFNMMLPQFHRSGYRIVDEVVKRWLENRIAIFERVCLPSVAAQTHPPDIWMVGFDALYREALTPLINALLPYPWILPVWQEIENGKHVDAYWSFKQAIAKTFSADSRWLLTARIDNDDAMNVRYCESIRNHAASFIETNPDKTDFWISFPRGLQLGKGVCRSLIQENNAFLARCVAIEPDVSDWPTALDGNHAKVFERSDVFLSPVDRAMWLQYVHGTNLSNAERKSLPVVADVKAALAEFGLNESLLNFTPPAVDRESLFAAGKTSPSRETQKIKSLLRKLFSR